MNNKTAEETIKELCNFEITHDNESDDCDLMWTDVIDIMCQFSTLQNKELIEELETERKLGLKLNSDYTDLNTRLSAELSRQKELVEAKDKQLDELAKEKDDWYNKAFEISEKHEKFRLSKYHQITQFNDKISDLQSSLTTKDKEIEELNNSIVILETEISELKISNESLREYKKHSKYWKEVNELKSTIESQAKEIEFKEKEIREILFNLSTQSLRIKELEEGITKALDWTENAKSPDWVYSFRTELLNLLSTPTTEEVKEDKCKCEKWQGINLSGNCYTCQKPI